ncbi:hypothetical protein GCM10022399_37510 [Terrabacter ginsenosidimutans]|uniref:Uncharacterized protein n=1 Tax=Terrabacter ginsenosidimutans TaxID=490575 RepID=A0ABP7ECV8_9MICO
MPDPTQPGVGLNATTNPATQPPGLNRQLADELRAEIARLDEDVRSASEAVDRVISMAGLIAAGVVTLGFARNASQPLVTLVAPYGLTIVVTYLLQLYTDIERRIALRQHLEDAMGSQGAPMHQPLILNRSYRNRTSVRLIALVYACVMLVIFAVSWTNPENVLSQPWLWAHRGGLILALIVMFVAGKELNDTSDKVNSDLEQSA